MIPPPERSLERDAAIDALAAVEPFPGWNVAALRRALAATGAEPEDAGLLFPGGAADLIEAFIDLADRRMAETTASEEFAASRLPVKVRALVAGRLRRMAPHKEAVRRAAALLALPQNARLAARCTARTVDEIWHLAGDRAADFSWYTKRATLTAIYSTTLLYWLRDQGEDDSATLALLDRMLAGVARFGRGRSRLQGRLAGLRERMPGCRPRAA